MTVPIYNMRVYQGADYTLTVTFEDRNLTGYTVRMQGRKTFDAAGTVFDWTTANGYIALAYSSPDTTVTISATAAQTATLGHPTDEHGVEGVYDCEIVSPTGVVERAFQGTFAIDPEVTR